MKANAAQRRALGQARYGSEVKNAGMGRLDTGQADVLEALISRNINKSPHQILAEARKDPLFKNVAESDLLKYINQSLDAGYLDTHSRISG